MANFKNLTDLVVRDLLLKFKSYGFFNILKPFFANRQQEIASFIKFQDKEMEQFVEERDKLTSIHEDMKRTLKQNYWKEEVELEKSYEIQVTKLIEKFAPSLASSSSSSLPPSPSSGKNIE